MIRRLLIAILVVIGLLCAPLAALTADGGTRGGEVSNGAGTPSSDDVPPEIEGKERAADYFVPYLLRRGDVVQPPLVFGFHRDDVEKIHIVQQDLKVCRGHLDDCTRLESPDPRFRWSWLETGVGVAAGAGLSVLIFYLAK